MRTVIVTDSVVDGRYRVFVPAGVVGGIRFVTDSVRPYLAMMNWRVAVGRIDFIQVMKRQTGPGDAMVDMMDAKAVFLSQQQSGSMAESTSGIFSDQVAFFSASQGIVDVVGGIIEVRLFSAVAASVELAVSVSADDV